MSIGANYVNKSNKNMNLINLNKTNAVNSKTQQLYAATAMDVAAKLLNYKTIAPAPPPAASSDYKPIAPAPAPSTASNLGVKTRKYTPRVSNNRGAIAPYSGDQTQSVQRRNARERNRVKQVNNSFARLRQHLPQYIVADLTKGGGRGPHKKISKVDTLRIAVEYIRRLEYLVDDLSGSGDSSEAASVSSFTSNHSTTAASPPPTALASALFYPNATSQQLQPKQQQQLPQLPQLPQQQQQQQQQCFPTTLLTPVSLSAFSPLQTKVDSACHSPTASYTSNMSFDSGTFDATHQMSPEPSYTNANGVDAAVRSNANLTLKFEPYDSFKLHEEDCTPDDDDIIDYISLWQEEQQASHI